MLSKEEIHSRYEVYLEIYAKNINIEAQSSIQMVKRQYIPVIIRYAGDIASSLSNVKGASAPVRVQKELLSKVSGLLDSASNTLADLEEVTAKAQGIHEAKKRAEAFRDKVVPAMSDLRADIDALETITSACYWPVPTYSDMLFKL